MQPSNSFGSFSIQKKPPQSQPTPKRAATPFPQGSNKKQKTSRGSADKGEDRSDDSEAEGQENAEEQATPEERQRKESILQQMTRAQQARHEAFATSTFYKGQKKTFKNVCEGESDGMDLLLEFFSYCYYI
jgi:hypothetical protein